MNKRTHQILNILISSVWFINGLICKVFNLVPRHREIVARILGVEHARTFTILIGISETFMAIWIISGKWSRMNALVQIAIIAIMNTMEFMLVPNLLLWGRVNALFAFLFILLIYFTEFHLNRKIKLQR